MDAVEYLKTFKKICDTNNCVTCPLTMCHAQASCEERVKQVEEYLKNQKSKSIYNVLFNLFYSSDTSSTSTFYEWMKSTPITELEDALNALHQG